MDIVSIYFIERNEKYSGFRWKFYTEGVSIARQRDNMRVHVYVLGSMTFSSRDDYALQCSSYEQNLNKRKRTIIDKNEEILI